MNPLLSSMLCGLFFAALTQPATSNLAAPMTEYEVALKQESVEVDIRGNMAKVTGTFTFVVTRSWYDEVEYDLYLPVYGAPGTDPDELKPSISKRGKELTVEIVDKAPFEKISTLSGQEAFWFKTKVTGVELKEFQSSKRFTIEIGYKQALSQGAFIYTPLIPKQKKGVDYGEIRFRSERGLKLREPKTHQFIEKEGKLVVEPDHTRSIVVELTTAFP